VREPVVGLARGIPQALAGDRAEQPIRIFVANALASARQQTNEDETGVLCHCGFRIPPGMTIPRRVEIRQGGFTTSVRHRRESAVASNRIRV
jgi:hypothetical protein